ncbi:MAG TPA: sigma-70 family RNA polymerase sigma factor [Polyangiaceae bacterium]
MIDRTTARGYTEVVAEQRSALMDPAVSDGLPATSASGLRQSDVSELVRTEFRFVWRLLRRLGLPEGDADDAAQQVFLVAAQRFADLLPGRERSFLYTTALHVALKTRRSVERRREDLGAEVEPDPDGAPSIEDLLDRRRARELLDSLLDTLPLDLRAVLVLHEIDELSAAEIAEVIGVPVGTAASRLRRARELFGERLRRFEARLAHTRGLTTTEKLK